MAVVKPLFINSDNNLQEMTDAQVLLHKQKAIYQYSLDPSALLTVVSNSGANMAAITDTRLKSGVSVVSVSADPSASTSAPSATTDVSFDKINFAYDTSSGQTEDSDNRAFPIYRNSDGDIRAMSLSDMKDTFLHPAIDLMVVADASADDSNVAGTYRIHTASSLTDFTEVSGANTAIFTDTTSTGFAAGSIGTAGSTQTGSSSSVQSFFLLRRNGTDVDTNSIKLAQINSDGDIQEYSDGGTELLGNWLKFTAGQSGDGYKITYAIGASVSGTQRGSSILNKQLGSTVTSTTLVNADDYRAQQFPSGSATTTNTYLFKINKA
jgi:hypothetical protein|tara:strand:- start:725 stop:1693 length:969 start_codon:yes stop_codon:yes gene_type:complete